MAKLRLTGLSVVLTGVDIMIVFELIVTKYLCYVDVEGVYYCALLTCDA
jgi:hypothetical protein